MNVWRFSFRNTFWIDQMNCPQMNVCSMWLMSTFPVVDVVVMVTLRAAGSGVCCFLSAPKPQVQRASEKCQRHNESEINLDHLSEPPAPRWPIRRDVTLVNLWSVGLINTTDLEERFLYWAQIFDEVIVHTVNQRRDEANSESEGRIILTDISAETSQQWSRLQCRWSCYWLLLDWW